MPSETCHQSTGGRAWIATTQWTVVARAGSGSSEGFDALTALCRAYWYPIYAFVRRKGYAPHDAQDLTQDFFARLIEKNVVGAADRGKGRFRSFLLGALDRFLAKKWRDGRRIKRGGGRGLLSLDEARAEDRYQCEPADPLTPERLFERRWALTLLGHAFDRLRDECEAEGKGALFDALKGLLTGERAPGGYPALARQLGMSEGALMTAVHRLRRRYGVLLREEVARTVTGHGETEAELRHLLSVLGDY